MSAVRCKSSFKADNLGLQCRRRLLSGTVEQCQSEAIGDFQRKALGADAFGRPLVKGSGHDQAESDAQQRIVRIRAEVTVGPRPSDRALPTADAWFTDR